MSQQRPRNTPEQVEEVRKKIARRAEEVRISAFRAAEQKKNQDEKNALNAAKRADKDSDNAVYEESRSDDRKPSGRVKRGQLAKEAEEKAAERAKKEKEYRWLTHEFGRKRLEFNKGYAGASTVSLAKMQEVLKRPRAPVVLLSDEEEESRRSYIYDPPPPPRSSRGRASALWETFPESWRGSGDSW